jgi:hypothetical protein
VACIAFAFPTANLVSIAVLWNASATGDLIRPQGLYVPGLTAYTTVNASFQLARVQRGR